MTAEVAILNRSAAALAADSAVTLGGTAGKIYNTANKMFALSRIHPVAIMIYASGSFGTLPWETVVKEYRRSLGNRAFPRVEGYVSDFCGYLRRLVRTSLSQDDQSELVRQTAVWELDRLREPIAARARFAAETGTEYDDEAKLADLKARIEERIVELRDGSSVSEISAQLAGRELNAAVDDWGSLVDSAFGDIVGVDSEVRRRARVLVRSSIRTASTSPWASGVVITGFGDEQFFPAIHHLLVDGAVANRLRSREFWSAEIGKQHSAGIYPFAQEEMVGTFMDGVHPGYRDAVTAFLQRAMTLITEHFTDRVRGDLDAADVATLERDMRDAVRSIQGSFQQDLDGYLRQENSDPIMKIVDMLPKEELAEMAEALVNLTSFKRRVTPDAETVGGPIDVAVVSKGDGLVWIRRKHYFDPGLNPRFFDRDRFAGRMGEDDHDE